MGRGRQKAKQTKVARDLKYFSPPTDLTALQRELQSASSPNTSYDDDRTEWSDDEEWSGDDQWATDDDDEDEAEQPAPARPVPGRPTPARPTPARPAPARRR